jgi:Uma2 family endonuclease
MRFSLYMSALRRRPCCVYTSDLGVKLARAHVYPDMTVVCGAPRFLDANEDRLLNPTLILEVLSPSTEVHDRGKKLERYQALESLQVCLSAAQDEPHLEVYTRHAEG